VTHASRKDYPEMSFPVPMLAGRFRFRHGCSEGGGSFLQIVHGGCQPIPRPDALAAALGLPNEAFCLWRRASALICEDPPPLPSTSGLIPFFLHVVFTFPERILAEIFHRGIKGPPPL